MSHQPPQQVNLLVSRNDTALAIETIGMTTRRVTIDLVTERPSDGAFILVLVEEGPWADETDGHLQRIQGRLYDCVDAAVHGHLAARYPESRGKPAVIRLNCYDTPDRPVREFMKRFAECIAESEEVQRDMAAQRFVQSLVFEYNWRTLENGG
jgi:uncharacterized protein DUF6572